MKKLLSILLTGLCFLTITSAKPVNAAFLEEGDVVLKLNNSYVLYSSQEMPYIDSESGRMLLPIRMLADFLGFKTEWEEQEKRVIVNTGAQQIIFTVGQASVLVDGEEHLLDTRVVIKNGTTMVPARFFAETLGLQVDWDGKNRIVHLQDTYYLEKWKALAFLASLADEEYESEARRLSPRFKELWEKGVRFFKNQHAERLDEMPDSRVDRTYLFVPQKAAYLDGKILVKVLNSSEKPVKPEYFHKNVFFYSAPDDATPIWSRGYVSSDGTFGYNSAEIPAGAIYDDWMQWDDEAHWGDMGRNIRQLGPGRPLKYILANYFTLTT